MNLAVTRPIHWRPGCAATRLYIHFGTCHGPAGLAVLALRYGLRPPRVHIRRLARAHHEAALDKMIARYGQPEVLGLYQGLEKAIDEAMTIKADLDYPAGPTYHLMGSIPRCSDQSSSPAASPAGPLTSESNSLFRPLGAYNGVEQRSL